MSTSGSRPSVKGVVFASLVHVQFCKRAGRQRPAGYYSKMLARLGLGLFIAGLLVAACGGGNYTGAGIGLGAAVTGAGLNRAVTGDCWANCRPGYGCDRPRGTCVPVECAPACADYEHCVLEADGRMRCIDNLGTLSFGARSTDASTD